MGRYRTMAVDRSGPETMLDEKMTEAAFRLVREGVKPNRALRTLGVSQPTISHWRKKAREGLTPYVERIERVDLAEAMFLGEVEIHLGDEARTGDWRASDRVLTKRLPGEYGDRLALDQVSDASASLAELSDEELDALLVERGLPTKVLAR